MGVLKSTTGQGAWQETAKGKLRTMLQMGSALAVVLTLGACSSVPDAINPVEWGKSVGEMFDGEDEETAVKSDEAIPGEDGDYPSLSDTPTKPVVTGDAERDALVAGLAADRQNAQYEQGGRRQSSPPVNALQGAPEVPVSEPVINPAPTTPVTSSSMADAGAAPAAAATTSAVTSAPSGSAIADEWNAKSAVSGPVPTPEAPPAAPTVSGSGMAGASGNDPVMDQYQRRLAEGQGVFANEPASAPTQEFDYSMYSDNGAVIVDESQFGGSEPMYGDSVSVDMSVTNDALASRLGVRSIDQAGPAVNEIQIAQIQFGHGSTKLGGADYNVLEQVAATWQQTSGFIRVIGHASMRTGNMSLEQHMAVNRRVSEGRASAVVSRLLALGVNPNAIFVGADGSTDPRYYEGVPAGEAGNRRVEIYLDY
ncbi:OmpA family protein [Thalassospira sp. HF15]|uniref:OmpA family protein n=1 Tax=Thalassospira sp. HF15 TaxID=2722755 RepID=UPI0014314E26|nr:OmpA family protein [Thalassospira sp. HF15]NIY74662.1 OmpA family protein [Thalassospira sp. HF15]